MSDGQKRLGKKISLQPCGMVIFFVHGNTVLSEFQTLSDDATTIGVSASSACIKPPIYSRHHAALYHSSNATREFFQPASANATVQLAVGGRARIVGIAATSHRNSSGARTVRIGRFMANSAWCERGMP